MSTKTFSAVSETVRHGVDFEELTVQLSRITIHDDTQPATRYIPSVRKDLSLVPVPLPSAVNLFARCLKTATVPTTATPHFLFLDTEGKVYINDIAAVSLDGTMEFHSKISSDPFFGRKDPKDAMPIGEFWTALSNKLPTKDTVCYVCMHNAFSHDLPLLKAVSSIPERFVFVDTLLFFWEIFGAWSSERARIPSCTLASLCKNILGHSFTEKNGAHTALADARVLRRLVTTVLRSMAHRTGDWSRFRDPDGPAVSLRCALAWIKYCSLKVPLAVITREDVHPLGFDKIHPEKTDLVHTSARAVTGGRQPVMHASSECKKMPRRAQSLPFGKACTTHRKCEVCFTRHTHG